MELSNKTALVTGASRGFGASAALALAKQGAHVIAVARTVGGLEDLDDQIKAAGGEATLVPLDICDHDGQARMCLAIHERWGGLDLWIHSAIHAAPLCPADHIDMKDWTKSQDINVTATMKLIVNISPLLQAHSGTAVHIEDPRASGKFFGTYGSSKTAQKALFDSWRDEHQNSAPQVLSFQPEPMATATRARFFPGEITDDLATTASQAERLIAHLKSV